MMQVKLKVSGMHCTSCAFNIDGELEDTNGVKEALTNYAKQETTVTFDDSEVSESDIVGVIKQLGYTAEKI